MKPRTTRESIQKTGRHWLIVVCWLVFSSTFACEHQTHGRIRIGLTASPGFALLYIANHRGFFVEEHVDVTIVTYQSSRDLNRGLFQGEIDLGCASEATIALNHSDHRPQTIYTQLHSAPNSDRIIFTKKSGIKKPSDLLRSTVALSNGAGSVYFLQRFMSHHHLDARKMKNITIDRNDASEYFSKGLTDAMAANGLRAASLEKELEDDYGGSFVLDGLQEHSLLYGRPFASETQKQSIVNILKALLKANEYLASNPEDARSIVKLALSPQFEADIAESVMKPMKIGLGLTNYLKLNIDEVVEWTVAVKKNIEPKGPNNQLTLTDPALKTIEPRLVTIF